MKYFLIFVSSFLITACNNNEADRTSEPQSQPTLFDAQLDAKKKAEELEQSLLDATKLRDEEMQKQGG